MPAESTSNPPAALMLLAPGCPHCPGMLDALARLVKEGIVGRLEVVNVALHPEVARELGVRSVPWVRIGSFELAGARTMEELRTLAQGADTPEGVLAYLERRLADGGLTAAQVRLAREPHLLPPLLRRIADPELPLQIRLGIGALVEGLAATDALASALPVLIRLAADPDHRVRADACHYLGLTGRPEARAPLQACLADPDADVREIAEEALQSLP